MFLAHGGRVEQYLDRKSGGFVTHVIATNLTPAKMKEYRQLKVVWPAWIVDSVRAGRLLSWSTYRWTPGSVDPGAASSSSASVSASTPLASYPAGTAGEAFAAEGVLDSPLPTLEVGSRAPLASPIAAAGQPRAEHLAPVAPSRTLVEAFAGQRGRQVQQQTQQRVERALPQPPTGTTIDGDGDDDEGELLIMDAPSPPPPTRPTKRKASSPSPTGRQKRAAVQLTVAVPVALGPSRSSKRLLALAEREAEAAAKVSSKRADAADGLETAAIPDPSDNLVKETDAAKLVSPPSTTEPPAAPFLAASVGRMPSALLAAVAASSSTTASEPTLTSAAVSSSTMAAPIYPRPGSEAATLSAKKGYWMAGENAQAKRLMGADDGWRERHTAVNEGFLEGYYQNSRCVPEDSLSYALLR